jgi:hypothetical protein
MFKQMENIGNFLKACRALGVPSFDCFETLDLFEEKNMVGVLRCVWGGWMDESDRSDRPDRSNRGAQSVKSVAVRGA